MAVNLAMVIEEQGRKASWIAMKLGVSGSTITLWAQGKREIPPKRVKQLAELLGVVAACKGRGCRDSQSITTVLPAQVDR